jgi:hypothetical protein
MPLNAQPPNPHFTLSTGQSLIFGYGSLLLQESMEVTLGQPYRKPCYKCALRGWRRSWDVFMPNDLYYEPGPVEFVPDNIVYLNIRPGASCSANGLLYVLDPGQIDALDRREWIYDRCVVTGDLMGVVIEGGDAYVYTAKPEWELDPDHVHRDKAAIRQSYLDIVERGIKALGEGFRSDFDLSTDSLPVHLVFSDARRPK